MSRIAWALALAGFIPFAAGLLWLLFADDPSGVVGFALKGYGAVILSFLGGIRWAFGLMRADRDGTADLAASVLPPLLGWGALLLPAPVTFALLAAGFAAMGAWDSFAGHARIWPEWFSRLRMTLSVLVTGAMIVAFIATA